MDQRPPSTGAPSRSRRQRTATLALIGLVVVSVAGCSSASTPQRRAEPPTSSSSTTTPALCPLTGAPVPGGGPVPQRPALAVKVDNYPAGRPQSGLDRADVVVEEPVEGGVTRYVAIFQCQGASSVGPIRSARNIDIGIMGQFGQPLFAHVGGINPVLANIAASPLIDLDLRFYGSVTRHPAGRYAPYDTYSSTSALWGLKPSARTVPSPVFSYSATPPPGTAVSAVHIPFSIASNVVWTYDKATGSFERQYGSTPDKLANGVQNSAANVVVQFVHITYGPWVEDDTGALEVQANLYNGASGRVDVFRDGEVVTGTWHRSTLAQPTQLVAANGQPITLKPGRTWVELVPDTVNVTTVSPAPVSRG